MLYPQDDLPHKRSFRHQIELHYKSTFIYLYSCLRKEIQNILEKYLPTSITYLINSYLSIEKLDYLPIFPDIYQDRQERVTFSLMMWKSETSIQLSFTNPDFGDTNIIKSELLISCCCSKMLAKYVILFDKYYQPRSTLAKLTNSTKINRHQQIKILVTNLNDYQKKHYKLMRCAKNCQRLSKSPSNLNTNSCYLTWFNYHQNHDNCYYQLYYDLIELYIFINYHLHYL